MYCDGFGVTGFGGPGVGAGVTTAGVGGGVPMPTNGVGGGVPPCDVVTFVIIMWVVGTVGTTTDVLVAVDEIVVVAAKVVVVTTMLELPGQYTFDCAIPRQVVEQKPLFLAHAARLLQAPQQQHQVDVPMGP